MTDSNSKSDLLKNQAEMMNLAYDSVITEDQAKELLNGRLEDAFLIKAKVDVENRTGVLLILISNIQKKIIEVYSLFGNSPHFRKIRTFEDHQQISRSLVEIHNSGGIDTSLSELNGYAVYDAFNKEVIQNYLDFWEKKDTTGINRLLEQAIMKHTKANMVKVTSEVDKLSSIKFRFKNPMQGVINPIRPIQEDESPIEKNPEDLLPYQRQILDIVRPYSKEILCETVLAPMNGVNFDELVEGMEILFRIPYSTPQEKLEAQALGAVDANGKLKPVIGNFLIIVQGEGEYHIFAKGPNNTIFHSIEESPVRIATPHKKSISHSNIEITTETDNTGVIVIGAIAAIVIIIMIVALL